MVSNVRGVPLSSTNDQVQTERLALYTTVYPGVEKYLSAWYESVLMQNDQNFDIWIGVDHLLVSDVISALGVNPGATWILADEGDSPAQIRQKAIAKIVNRYPAVVLVDSDDMLEPTRVEAAREYLESSDVNGCAMYIVDEQGHSLEGIFKPPNELNVDELLPRNNVFGLSNTAYRSKILRQCLPIPNDCALVDWYLITRAWALGARLSFDYAPRMAYRQHPHNVAYILPPFTVQQIVAATDRVLAHYRLVLGSIPDLQSEQRIGLETGHARLKEFCKSIKDSPDRLNQYVSALNELPFNHVWWSCVAHPQLEGIWKS